MLPKCSSLKKILLVLPALLLFFLPVHKSLSTQQHLNSITEFKNSVVICAANLTACANLRNINQIITLSAKIANEFSVLLLHEGIDELLTDALSYLPPEHAAHRKLVHMRSIIYFSQGYTDKAQQAWAIMNSSDLPAKRTLSVQMIMTGHELEGLSQFKSYCNQLLDNFGNILGNAAPSVVNRIGVDLSSSQNSTLAPNENAAAISNDTNNNTGGWMVVRSSSNLESEEILMNVFLTEVQGGVHLNNKRSDVLLCTHDFRPIDAELRFGLGVGLAKLGLYDLSLRHVSMSATPWESPLFRLRAMLVFQPVHSSVRSLAMSVDNFEKQAESILLEGSRKNRGSAMMDKVCNSLNHMSLAIQALPLLHLAGYTSPRDELVIGHSAVALPVLLSEVYTAVCASSFVSTVNTVSHTMRWNANIDENQRKNHNDEKGYDEDTAKAESTDQPSYEGRTPGGKNGAVNDRTEDKIKLWDDEEDLDEMGRDSIVATNKVVPVKPKLIKIGFISGSFDGLSGKIVLAMITPGIVERIKEEDNIIIVLTAMCLPTPRSHLTDMANAAFHHHINLPPDNKTESVLRIRQSKQDFIIFSDAGLDSRVFALAHERMAPYQAIMWGWGGTLGIPAIDYYLVPDHLWSGASCALMKVPQTSAELDSMEAAGQMDKYNVAPQDLFHEQVVLLNELPMLPLGSLSSEEELASVMKDRFRVPPLNESSVYLFPGSVRHLHPEFDTALATLLRTDAKCYVLVTLPRMGRDGLPTTHVAGRHDLMHPTNPPAAVEKLKQRLKKTIGVEAAGRVRILPPLDERIFSTLLLHVVAVLDPFPVGLHVSITEAFMRGVPIVSAPKMQECTNSHAFGIASVIGVKGPGFDRDDWPSTAEEYAVLAIRLQGDRALRNDFLPPMTREYGETGLLAPTWTNPKKHSHKGLKMVVDLVQRLT